MVVTSLSSASECRHWTAASGIRQIEEPEGYPWVKLCINPLEQIKAIIAIKKEESIRPLNHDSMPKMSQISLDIFYQTSTIGEKGFVNKEY